MKHLIILFICTLLAVSVQCEAAFKMKITRTEIVRCNQEYMEIRLWLTKPDRYTNAMNCDLTIHNMPLDTKVKIKLYEFLSNEYRPFAINLERRLCHCIELEYKMMLYQDLLKIGAHMPEPRCPMKPGNYSFANFVPDVNNYPPNLPFHNYMLEISFWHGPVEMAVVRIYGTLDRDAYIREQYSRPSAD